MDKKRRKEEKKYLDQLYKNESIQELLDNVHLLYRNNDFLYGIRSKSFDWAVSNIKEIINLKKKDAYTQILCDFIDYGYIMKYFEIINKSANFIKRNIPDDNLHRYAFIQSLFANNCFSGGTTNNEKYKDFFFAIGIDVILGNSCCRHRSSLLRNILNEFNYTLDVDIGLKENDTADHAVILMNHDEKKLFLNSVKPSVYYPLDRLELFDIRGKQYIKTVPTFIMNDNFKNIDEYYDYFRQLYFDSMISISEYKRICNDISGLYKFYLFNYDLSKNFMETIEYETKELKLACGRKL